MNKTKLCVIGTGTIFQQYHLEAIQNSKLFQIAYLIDKNIETAKKAKKISTDNPELLDNVSININCETFFIATPPESRLPIFNSIKNKAKVIIFEKPIAFDHGTFTEIKNECQRLGIKCMVAQTRRFFPNLLTLNNSLKTISLGDSLEIKAFEGGPFGWKTESNYFAKENPKDGGIIHDVGAHIFDYISILCATLNISLADFELESSFVDFLDQPNYSVSSFKYQKNNKSIHLKVGISRSIVLSDSFFLKSSSGVSLKTRSLFSPQVKIMKDKKELLIIDSSTKYPTLNSLNAVFREMWSFIGHAINSVEYLGLNDDYLNIETVEDNVITIDKVFNHKKQLNHSLFKLI